MAKLKKPLLSLGVRGTIADNLTFQKRGQLTIARKKPVPTDPKSPAQLAHRQIYKDAVAAWHTLTPEEQEAWRGVCPGLTAYQCFMRSQLRYIPPPIPIDIGSEAILRDQIFSHHSTIISKDNPANASGIITTVEIWALGLLEDCIVGTFYTTNGNTLKCRDSALIGAVPSGSKQTFSGLTIAVVTADYIGTYYQGGWVARHLSGYAGLWYINGEYIDPGDEAVYSFISGNAISLHGIGEVPA